MDTDLSHEAVQRFEALESRVSALEGGEEVTDESPSEGVFVTSVDGETPDEDEE